MQKSKQQLKDESVERFNIQTIAAKKDINELKKDLDEIDLSNILEAPPEAINVIMSIRRDLLMCRDSIKRISRVLKRGD